MPCSAADLLFVTEATVLTNNAILAQIADSMRVHDQWIDWLIDWLIHVASLRNLSSEHSIWSTSASWLCFVNT